MTALGSMSLRCDLGSVARASTRATSTRLDRFGSSFLAPSAVQTWHRPPSRRLPATRFRVAAAGGGDRPSWTEAAAGMGRGRTKGEARVPKPPKRGKNPPSSDPDAAGRASRRAAASGARASSERNADADDFARGRGRGRGRGASRGASRGSSRGSSRGAPHKGRVVAETGGAAARAAAADAPRSSAAVTSRNVDALASFFARRTKNAASSAGPQTETLLTYSGSGFRLVRCMPHLRRREADDAVSSGRVLVNGQLVRPSRRVVSGDVVTLDGKAMDWEPFAAAVEADIADTSSSRSNSNAQEPSSRFVYLKYNKPRGVTCTMEPSQKSSMLYALKDELKVLAEARRKQNGGASLGGQSSRVFPVGRLDRDSSGLVLLTDDGRVPEALLDPKNKASKTYDVDVDRFVSDKAIEKLRSGVVISTTQQRDGITTTAATSPCEVSRIPVTKGSHGADALRFVLTEGRNRQIRKMCEAIGVEVTSLHRRSIGDVSLSFFSAPEDGDDEKRKTENAGSGLECGGVRAVEGEELMYLARAVAESAARRQAAPTGGAKARAAAPEGWGKRIRDGR
jgi:pseudouridine synthase